MSSNKFDELYDAVVNLLNKSKLIEERLLEYWRLHELLREAIDKHPHDWDDGDYKVIKNKLDDIEKRFGI